RRGRAGHRHRRAQGRWRRRGGSEAAQGRAGLDGGDGGFNQRGLGRNGQPARRHGHGAADLYQRKCGRGRAQRRADEALCRPHSSSIRYYDNEKATERRMTKLIKGPLKGIIKGRRPTAEGPLQRCHVWSAGRLAIALPWPCQGEPGFFSEVNQGSNLKFRFRQSEGSRILRLDWLGCVPVTSSLANERSTHDEQRGGKAEGGLYRFRNHGAADGVESAQSRV